MLSFFTNIKNKRTEIFTLASSKPIPTPLGVSNHLSTDPQPVYFEPKVNHRFIMEITDQYNKVIIPSYVIRCIDRPSYTINWFGKPIFNPFKITLYDPIVPSSTQNIEVARWKKSKWNIKIKILGPIADTVEEWEILNAKIKSASHSSMDWSDSGNPALVTIIFKIKNVKLLY